MPSPSISHYIWPGQVQFGFGAAALVGREAKALQVSHVFVIADPGVVAAGLTHPVTDSLKAAGLSYDLYDRVVPNPDTGSVDAAVAAFLASKADGIVAIGGGSGLDTAKAVRLAGGGGGTIAEYALMHGDKTRSPGRQMVPMIALPTTAGTGAEVTPWAVITDLSRKLKMGVGGAFLVPTVAVIDPELMLSLPPMLTAATGMDALTHCIEAYVSTNNNPALDPMILHGIELVGRSLRVAVAQGKNRQARYDMALAAMIGGIGISSKWLGACHSLAHQLSGFADVPHGVAIAIMLPHQMSYSMVGALDRYARVGQALGVPPEGSLRQQAEAAVEAVHQLNLDCGLPTRLRDVGVTEEMIKGMAYNAYNIDLNWWTNPRAVSEAVMEQLYRSAF
ncbi:MAG: iron-containing alcohol dehydrogenase [Anaerolineales bacterium]|nr:iron-containing alcohol dehydrogenase [Anaerolineales bacterium]